MSTRHRHRDPETANGDPQGAPPSTDRRRERLAAANRLAAAADSAIDRCISEDSEAFLRANRQRGGQ